MSLGNRRHLLGGFLVGASVPDICGSLGQRGWGAGCPNRQKEAPEFSMETVTNSGFFYLLTTFSTLRWNDKGAREDDTDHDRFLHLVPPRLFAREKSGAITVLFPQCILLLHSIPESVEAPGQRVGLKLVLV